MAFFIPRNQLRNMLDAQVGQALKGGPIRNTQSLGQIVALSSLLNQNQPQGADNWLDDNWMDDGNLWG